MTAAVPTCPGCGLAVPDGPEAPPQRYRASSGCWGMYGELLARSYADPAYHPVHQLLVDAYAAQHPGGDEPEQVRRLALCLMTLDLFVARGHDPRRGPDLHQRMAARLPDLETLAPPEKIGTLTVADVLGARDADEHARLVRAWASEVWEAWAPHHATVRRWNDGALG